MRTTLKDAFFCAAIASGLILGMFVFAGGLLWVVHLTSDMPSPTGFLREVVLPVWAAVTWIGFWVGALESICRRFLIGPRF